MLTHRTACLSKRTETECNAFATELDNIVPSAHCETKSNWCKDLISIHFTNDRLTDPRKVANKFLFIIFKAAKICIANKRSYKA